MTELFKVDLTYDFNVALFIDLKTFAQAYLFPVASVPFVSLRDHSLLVLLFVRSQQLFLQRYSIRVSLLGMVSPGVFLFLGAEINVSLRNSRLAGDFNSLFFVYSLLVLCSELLTKFHVVLCSQGCFVMLCSESSCSSLLRKILVAVCLGFF